MLSKKKVLSAIIGMTMLALPASGLAFNYSNRAYNGRLYTNDYHGARAYPNAPLQLAQDEHHHDVDAQHPRTWDNDDYRWGGSYRYHHPPAYYSAAPPTGYSGSQRHDYLLQRRAVAYQDMREMQARGDTAAANRLAQAIQQINVQIARTR
jgi:hypothetical protein